MLVTLKWLSSSSGLNHSLGEMRKVIMMLRNDGAYPIVESVLNKAKRQL